MSYTIKQVADIAGVSVRTLHHYHSLGLLKPAAVSTAGYRLYAPADLEQLQQVLFFRELGFALSEIGAIVHTVGFNRREALASHRLGLVERRDRIDRLLALLDKTVESQERNYSMESSSLFSAFNDRHSKELQNEARKRWGTTSAYQEGQRRTAAYAPDVWREIKAESSEIELNLATLMDKDPADPSVQLQVSRHHNQLEARFYPCSPEMYRALGDLYVEDARFAEHYNAIRPGLASFLHAAIDVFCQPRA